MARKKREYEDDDGRTIVDMSQVSRPNNLWVPRAPGGEKGQAPAQETPGPEENRPWEETKLTREERRMYVLGALKAALLIGLAFLVGLGAVVVIMLLAWT